MAKEFKLPDLGEGIHEAQVINVLVKQGDQVAQDQNVLEVETDKAAVELPVPFGGVISALNVKTGDTVKVGQVLLAVDEAGGRTGGAKSAQQAAPARAEEAPRARKPDREPEPESDEDEAPPARRPEAPARAAARHDEPQPRASQAAPSRGGERAASGGGRQPAADDNDRPSQRRGAGATVAEAPSHDAGPIPAAPAVRRYAREQGIDLREVHGTGPGGRIVREDVERFALAGPTGREAGPRAPANREPEPVAERPAVSYGGRGESAGAPAAAPHAEALPDFSQWGQVRREKIPQIRKAIARQMVRSYLTIPHVMHGDEADVTDLENFRKEHGQVMADKGAKLTLTAFLVKAVAGALQQFPQFNASYDDTTTEMIFKDYVHIGIAVDTPRGLMVPIVRDVDRKSLARISKEMKDLADRAREFKIDISEMRGGSFTVTNVGALGGTVSTPIINYPEVAILGIGKLAWKPVVRDGQIVARQILPMFLSFDHRVIDGADSARFIKTVISYLENPLNLLLVS